MEKVIEIKRRAQRCILSGDLDGAMAEYEKLVATGDRDPGYFVLLADLLFKKGMASEAEARYFEAVDGYERQGVYKNAIAVCKKMSRLAIATLEVSRRLGDLHRLDGFPAEAGLCYVQHAELLIDLDRLAEARDALVRACEASPELLRALERLGEVEVLAGNPAGGVRAWDDAASRYEQKGNATEAKRWRNRADQLRPAASASPATADAGNGTSVPLAMDLEELLGSSHGDDSTAAPPAAVPEWETGLAPAPPGLDASARDTGDGLRGPSSEDPFGAGRLRLAPVEPQPDDRPADASDAAPTVWDFGIRRSDDIESESQASHAQASVDAPHTPSAHENGTQTAAGAPAAAVFASAAEDPAAVATADPGMTEISGLLQQAQSHFHDGDRDAASMALVRAAQAYDQMGRWDSAAAIYRSLGASTDSSLQLMMLWMKNCQRRDDHLEAARVACDLGDRALNDGDQPGARDWFERALSYDSANEIAARRLRRLESGVVPPPPPVAEVVEDPGTLSIRTDRDEPVIIDLGTLIEDFQRGVSAQLASDPQGNYDLAMSYREMGLYDQAVESFRIAAREPAFFLRSTEMIGRCMLEVGQFDEAAYELAAALESEDLPSDVAHDLRYQRGLALEAAGRAGEALAEFERVHAKRANFPDVAMKIRVLRKSLEAC